LPILTEAERRQLIYEWNETQREYPQDKCVHQFIEEHTERAPNQIAVIHGEQEITYGELNRRSNQLARYLQKKGVGPETIVAANLERSPELIIAALAILKAGGAFVGLDPSHPRERTNYVVQDTGARVVITRESLVDQVVTSTAEIVPIDSAWNEICLESAANPESSVRSDNLAYAAYTSGSTGRPKGIVVTHRSFVNYVLAMTGRFEVSAADRRLQFMSPISELFVSGTFSPLMCGAAVVQRLDPGPPSIADFVRFIEEKQVTWIGVPSAYWHEWVTLVAQNEARVPSSLGVVTTGMDKVRPDLVEVWRRQVGPRVRLFNVYGPAETTCASTLYQAGSSSDEKLLSVPIGRPLANTNIYLVDKYENPVPIGVIGEVYIGGHGVARGYIGRPDLIAERFVPDSFSDTPGERLYRTGDLARYRPDGNIEFIGRADHQVKVRGFRVELEEIEAVLRQHPMVRQAVVVAEKQDGGDKRLAAYIVGDGDASINVTELRRFLRERLPEYMVPSAFRVLEKFPLTRTGKVDRLALPAAEPIRTEPDEDFVAPRTEMEMVLADIWQEALKVDRVGVYDNFFNLGGHSLLSLQVIDKIEKQVGLRITPKDLIFQTLAQLAAACDHAKRDGVLAEPVSPAQKLWSGLKKIVLGAGDDRR
jgi:amino acid adenylation domain-containing protein